MRVGREGKDRKTSIILFWGIILCGLLSAQVQAAVLTDVEPAITADSVTVTVKLDGNCAYRVWYTPSPSKVIIDLYETTYAPKSKSISLDDVLVKRIRITQYAGYTRVVMDLKQRIPEPEYWFADGNLVVFVDKEYNQGFEISIAPGVRYGQFRRGSGSGQVLVNYVKADLNNRRISVKPVLANGGTGGLQRVGDMVAAHNAVAAINGTYFANGMPLGLLIIDEELVSYPIFNRTALGFTKNGKAIFEQVDFTGEIVTGSGERVSLTGVNRIRRADDIIVYTSEYGQSTRTNDYGIEVVVVDGAVVDVRQAGNTSIPENGVVISAHGTGRDALKDVKPGDELSVSWEMTPPWFEQGVVQAIGGGPRLVKDGKIFITSHEERFQPDIVNGRAPRTAVGLTADNQLLMVTVNGRKRDVSIGMTLTELAELMIDLGAVDAMNLDGGGSATLVVRDRVLNLPSDGAERPVASALLVLVE